MVFVKDLKKDFYDLILHQRVLVLVGLDVDALCAWKILQCDQILYTVVPVAGKQDLEQAFLENSEGTKHVVLVNVGGGLDIIELLRPDDDVVFYVCDSHLPLDLHNVFNQVQVKLLTKQDDVTSLPEFDEIFRDSDDESGEDSGNESSDTEGSARKRRRFDEEALEKRRDKRLWEQKRRELIFTYEEFSSYGTAACYMMYEMAWKMSKDTNDLLWLAIIGVTEQHISQKIERDKYMESIEFLQGHVSRLNHRPDAEEGTVSVNCLRVSFDSELSLCLYRHWSLLESMCHSPYIACKFRVWTLKGQKRLQEFLAEMGLPLAQCRQKFAAMDINLKESVKEMVSKFASKYSISEQDLFLPSFHAQYGYKNKYCASDVVSVCQAQLESIEKDMTPSDNFLKALDILNRNHPETMEKGLELAKLQQKGVVNQVNTFLDMNQIISAGPFLYGFVQEGTPDGRFFGKPQCLCRLARFALEAYCATSRNKKARMLPLVIGATLDAEVGTILVVGIPPISEVKCTNCFGKAFEQAANTTGSRMVQDSFDSHVIELKTEDRSKFFDALISLLH